jgi:hypothetical protein
MVDEPYVIERIREAKKRARALHADGVHWAVYELPPAPLDRRSNPSLVFESDNTVRIVRVFPAGWRGLSDEELLVLSWSA